MQEATQALRTQFQRKNGDRAQVPDWALQTCWCSRSLPSKTCDNQVTCKQDREESEVLGWMPSCSLESSGLQTSHLACGNEDRQDYWRYSESCWCDWWSQADKSAGCEVAACETDIEAGPSLALQATEAHRLQSQLCTMSHTEEALRRENDRAPRERQAHLERRWNLDQP